MHPSMNALLELGYRHPTAPYGERTSFPQLIRFGKVESPSIMIHVCPFWPGDG